MKGRSDILTRASWSDWLGPLLSLAHLLEETVPALLYLD